jgi:WD40 repeat protein
VVADLFGKDRDRPALDRVALVDRRTGEIARWLPGLTASVGQVFFSPRGERVVLAGATEIVVRDVATGAEVLRRVSPKDGARRDWVNTFFTPDGRLTALASLTQDKGKQVFVLWDVAADRPTHNFDRPAGSVPVGGQFVSPDGGHLYLPPAFKGAWAPGQADDRFQTGHLYELPAGRLVADVPPPPGADRLFASITRLGPGGTRALWITADYTSADFSPSSAVWTVRALPTGDELLRVPNKSLAEHANDFSPDGRFLAIGSARGHVELWDVDAKAFLFRWQPHGGKSVRHLAFTPDRDVATVADGDDRLVILRLKEVRERLNEMGLGW